jgi:hypothetical protein
VFINLTPLIPLSILGEGEEILERGLRPSFHLTPSPLAKGRGIKGKGFIK